MMGFPPEDEHREIVSQEQESLDETEKTSMSPQKDNDKKKKKKKKKVKKKAKQNTQDRQDTGDTGETRETKEKKKKNEFGRGVETLYRSSYRMQLALTTLADGKANIILSVNSLALTVLTVGGSLVADSKPWMLLPISIFASFSLAAMILAVLSTRPRLSRKTISTDAVKSGEADMLYFNNFPAVTADEYADALEIIVQDNQRLYRQMARSTHSLGCSLARKFSFLQLSYTVFTVGLLLSLGVFFIVFINIATDTDTFKPETSSTGPVDSATGQIYSAQQLPLSTQFEKLYNTYEPSGIQQLPNGKFFVVEDEIRHPFNLLEFNTVGNISGYALFPQIFLSQEEHDQQFQKLDDLEAIDIDEQGNIYVITSHSQRQGKDREPDREKFVRFQIKDNQFVDPIVITELKEQLLEAYPPFRENLSEEEGFNIEGLTFDAQKQQMLIGFRSPLAGKKAIIVTLENVDAMFDRGETARFAEQQIFLNLKGEGIRGMAYDPRLQGYLVISGAAAKKQGEFHLWYWNGRPEHVPQKITVPGLKGFEYIEGITPVRRNGQDYIFAVSDDGDMNNNRSAKYPLGACSRRHHSLRGSASVCQ